MRWMVCDSSGKRVDMEVKVEAPTHAPTPTRPPSHPPHLIYAPTRLQHTMQDPSQGVAAPLQNHLHLISAHQFPLVGNLALNVAFKYLLDAPMIVKTHAPMSWTYVNAPNDGTIWLEWLPQYRHGRLPSDGYVWGDAESVFRQEYGGYTIEGMVHQLGYRPGLDPVASHARTRYHFVAKAPNVNAAAPDPSLWIVHYHQAEHRNVLPVGQVPVDHQTRLWMHERQALQSQGRLEKRDFMLHDRDHWPHINGPTGGHMGHTMMAPGFYGSNPMPGQNRYGQGAPPAAKRQRTQGSSVGGPGANEGMPDTSIEDEENTALGDYFDHLTPREISTARYMQHHRWMEEVFSSPYASGQIVPADLGLGLMGEMKSLTDGLLEPPSMDVESAVEKQSEEPKPFTTVKKEQVEEFNKRVQKHLDDGQAEIERMKSEHAAKMQEWRKTKTLLQAEKRLRSAKWDSEDNFAYGLEEPEGKEQAAGKRETVEDVLKDVEGLLGVKFAGYADATLIEKGGWEEREPSPTPPQPSRTPEVQTNAPTDDVPESKGEQLEPKIPADVPQPNAPQPPASQQQPQAPPSSSMPSSLPAQGSIPQQQEQTNPSTGNSDLQLPEGMDLDTGDLQFPSAGITPIQTETPTQNQTPGDTTTFSAPQTTAPPSEAAASSIQNQPAQPPAQQATAAIASAGSNAPSTNPQGTPAGGMGDLQDTSMFNDSFGELAGDFGQGSGDGMLDFGDESAFGEALHGMDTPGDGDMFGAGGAEGAGS
ncbi:hypothetical protein Q7P37_006110 [Cladosporium fusiforme]